MLKNIFNTILSKIENFYLHNVKLNNKYPPLFIIAPPRSGTTILYLYLINNFKFAYFPNISKKNSSACVTYGLIGKNFCKPYQATYDNYYGILNGNMAPSDGWDIFERWFPNYNFNKNIREENLYELRNIIRLFEILFKAPFINKNISNSVRISYLERTFEDPLFIYIKRNIYDTISSLLKARKIHKTKLNKWWCTPPPQFYNSTFYDEVEQATAQVLGIKKKIEEDFKIIEDKRKFIISYESFCEHPEAVFDWVRNKYNIKSSQFLLKANPEPLKFTLRSRNTSGSLKKMIEKHLQEYNDK